MAINVARCNPDMAKAYSRQVVGWVLRAYRFRCNNSTVTRQPRLRKQAKPTDPPAHSSEPAFFAPPDFAFFAAVLSRFFTSSASTFGTMMLTRPPTFSIAAFAEAVAW